MNLLVIPFPQFDPVALAIGPISVKWYGLAYMAGLLLGWLYIRRLLDQPQLWRDDRPPFLISKVDDLLLYVTVGVVVGGRLGHVLFYEPAYYAAHPLQVFEIWRGGMAFHGGLLGTALAMWLFARRNSVSVWSVMDLVSAAVPFGLFFGRLANFVNSEIVGSKTSVPWAMVFPGWGPDPRHPAMIYEALLEGVVLFLILRFFTHSKLTLKSPGLTTGIFLVGYGAFRIFCELFKIVDYRLFVPDVPITKGMVYSVPMILLGLWFIHIAKKRQLSAKTAG